jgi:hypothetical protein
MISKNIYKDIDNKEWEREWERTRRRWRIVHLYDIHIDGDPNIPKKLLRAIFN